MAQKTETWTDKFIQSAAGITFYDRNSNPTMKFDPQGNPIDHRRTADKRERRNDVDGRANQHNPAGDR